jgi:hypothetical protein
MVMGNAGQGVLQAGCAVKLDAPEVESKVLEVDVGIDETGSDGTAVQINPFPLCAEKRFHVVVAAGGEDAIVADGDGGGGGIGGIHGVETAVGENKCSGHGKLPEW